LCTNELKTSKTERISSSVSQFNKAKSEPFLDEEHEAQTGNVQNIDNQLSEQELIALEKENEHLFESLSLQSEDVR
jgi:hypothetical protein